mgnify:CR=1 FL=1
MGATSPIPARDLLMSHCRVVRLGRSRGSPDHIYNMNPYVAHARGFSIVLHSPYTAPTIHELSTP